MLRGRVERAAIDRGVDVAAGVILLLVGVYALWRSTRARERRPRVATVPRPGRLFVVGVLDAYLLLAWAWGRFPVVATLCRISSRG